MSRVKQVVDRHRAPLVARERTFAAANSARSADVSQAYAQGATSTPRASDAVLKAARAWRSEALSARDDVASLGPSADRAAALKAYDSLDTGLGHLLKALTAGSDIASRYEQAARYLADYNKRYARAREVPRMSFLSSWLDGAARGAAERQNRARAGAGASAVAEWGALRVSRRRAVGAAATGVVGFTVLRYASPAFADQPACVPACLASANQGREGSYRLAENDREGNEAGIQKRIAAERKRLFNATTKKQRAASQARLAQLNQQLQQAVLQEILDQAHADATFETNRKKCLSDSQCGDPKKFPGGNPTQPPGGGSGDGNAQSCANGDHPCNCGGDVMFLCCLPYFTCKECCGS